MERHDPRALKMITRIIVRFEGYTGRYVWHCHVLEHEDNEMMRPYDVLPARPAKHDKLKAQHERKIPLCFLALLAGAPVVAQTPIGIFESETDIGTLLHPGASEYDAAKKTYTLTGSGDNMWATEDDFHHGRKSGNVTITADVAFATTTGNAHKKGVLMIRRSLDPDSDYVDAALHLAGLTSIQSRDTKGATTREVQSYMSAPKKLRLVKRGNYFFLYVAGADGVFHLSGGSMELALNEPFYVGLGACAHDKDAPRK